MELRRLRYFVGVAEEMHFGRAAERLHIAQQPLSVQIRKLEREIGHDLFERYSNRIRLTPAGQVLLREAREILERSEAALSLTRRTALGEIGTVRVGFCSTALTELIPKAMSLLAVTNPTLGVDLHELGQTEQLSAIERDMLDVGFAYQPFDERTFDAIDLFDEALVVAVPSHHRFAKASHVSIFELAQEPLVIFSADRHASMTAITDQVMRNAPSGKASYRVKDRATLLGLIAHGLGVGFLPERSTLPRIDIAYIPLKTSERLNFAVVWARNARESAARNRFIEAVSNVARREKTRSPIPQG